MQILWRLLISNLQKSGQDCSNYSAKLKYKWDFSFESQILKNISKPGYQTETPVTGGILHISNAGVFMNKLKTCQKTMH